MKHRIGEKNMSWTKDEERLLQQVQKNSVIENRDADVKESFWHVRNNEVDKIVEYGFETFQEVEEFLEKYIDDEQISLIIAAASIREKALHYKREHKVEKYVENSIDTGEIPDYVYIF